MTGLWDGFIMPGCIRSRPVLRAELHPDAGKADPSSLRRILLWIARSRSQLARKPGGMMLHGRRPASSADRW